MESRKWGLESAARAGARGGGKPLSIPSPSSFFTSAAFPIPLSYFAYILSPCPFPSTSVHTNSGQTTGELPVHFETQCLQCRRGQINEGDKQAKAETSSKREQGLLLPTCHPIRSWLWCGVWAWRWPTFPCASVQSRTCNPILT